jgi:hypothetical protein
MNDVVELLYQALETPKLESFSNAVSGHSLQGTQQVGIKYIHVFYPAGSFAVQNLFLQFCPGMLSTAPCCGKPLKRTT